MGENICLPVEKALILGKFSIWEWNFVEKKQATYIVKLEQMVQAEWIGNYTQ